MNYDGKKILVTGGRGFIGENLIKRLRGINAKVHSFDIHDGQNIEDRNLLNKTIRNQYDYIYHLAAFSGSQESLKEHELCFNINVLATTYLLEAVIKLSPQTKVILSSSRLEYGNPEYIPVDESHPTFPTSPYGLSKLVATQIAQIYAMTKKLRVTTFRTSNVYGPHSRKEFLGYNIINHFIDIAKKNKVIKIFGSGKQQRDYIFIDDLIDAFLLVKNTRSDGQIYNLGYGKGISLIDMADIIVKIIGKGKISRVRWPSDFRKVETGSYISDIAKITQELGFTPKISFQEGIIKTIFHD